MNFGRLGLRYIERRSYWQRASFDAVVVILSILGLLAFLPRWQRLRTHHFITGGVLLIVVASFCALLFRSLKHANDKLPTNSS